jgi:uncharacterized membrane protein YraQ (UPF0718 family)
MLQNSTNIYQLHPTGANINTNNSPALKKITSEKFPLNKPAPVYDSFIQFTNYSTNSKNDLFLKDYIQTYLNRKNITIPAGTKIDIISPRFIDQQLKQKVNDSIFKTFNGYADNFFNLMNLPDKEFQKKINALNVSAQVKQDLNEIHNFLDNYYKIKLTTPDGATYDLNKLNPQQKQELFTQKYSTDQQFTNELIQISNNLKELSRKFSRSELESEILFSSGEASRGFVKKFILGIAALAGIDHFVRPAVVNAVGGSATMAGKSLNKMTEFLAGCDDDVLGSIKDRHQDEVVLGKDRASSILKGTVGLGIATSILASFVYDKSKLGRFLLYSNLTSGGIVFSIAATYKAMMNDFDKNVKNGLIELPKPNMTNWEKFKFKAKTTWNNFKSYDVYLGKVLGVALVTPIALAIFKTGAHKSTNSLTKTMALILVGSVESYIATIVQVFRNNVRKSKIETSKELVVENLAQPQEYDPRHFEVAGTPPAVSISKELKNFVKTF